MSSFSKKRVLEILDQAQEGDNFSKLIDRFLGGMIVLNILAVSLESIEYLGVKYRQEFLYFEYLSIIVFGIEFLLRIWASSERQSSRFKSGYGTQARIYY
jgi:voltage-gated potassium channel